MKERLIHAYFTEGALIADHETLVALAAEVGLPEAEVREVLLTERYAEEVREDERTRRRRGISAVPCFVIDRKFGAVGRPAAGGAAAFLEHGWARARRRPSRSASERDRPRRRARGGRGRPQRRADTGAAERLSRRRALWHERGRNSTTTRSISASGSLQRRHSHNTKRPEQPAINGHGARRPSPRSARRSRRLPRPATGRRRGALATPVPTPAAMAPSTEARSATAEARRSRGQRRRAALGGHADVLIEPGQQRRAGRPGVAQVIERRVAADARPLASGTTARPRSSILWRSSVGARVVAVVSRAARSSATAPKVSMPSVSSARRCRLERAAGGVVVDRGAKARQLVGGPSRRSRCRRTGPSRPARRRAGRRSSRSERVLYGDLSFENRTSRFGRDEPHRRVAGQLLQQLGQRSAHLGVVLRAVGGETSPGCCRPPARRTTRRPPGGSRRRT